LHPSAGEAGGVPAAAVHHPGEALVLSDTSRISHSRSRAVSAVTAAAILDAAREIADTQSPEPMKNSPSIGFSLRRRIEDAECSKNANDESDLIDR